MSGEPGLPIFDDFGTTSHASIAAILRRLPPWVIFSHGTELRRCLARRGFAAAGVYLDMVRVGLSHVRLPDGSLTAEAAAILLDAGEDLQRAADVADGGAGCGVKDESLRVLTGCRASDMMCNAEIEPCRTTMKGIQR